MTKDKDRIQFRTGPLAADLQARTAPDASTSADLIARRDLERYYQVLHHDLHTVDLTREEAHLVCEALSTPDADPSPDTILGSILIAVHIDHLDRSYGVDARALTLKIKWWTVGQRYAVLDAVERWRLLKDERVDPDMALVRVGLYRPKRH
ncbi:hypothetical protein [Streptoalloteichus hindustanus]|uniref:Uncharacterized protein n=1 Tax=Streptoalloteichus hindustanus TaxID=2017 RepID=A0A1M5CPK9_STRHI|nr:hypothetical protein [Streptoalloteichus hindustanus]SHF56694.1 hypothetical protein SAMN05444320_104114 [Streptoalloteichus hindustanus]